MTLTVAGISSIPAPTRRDPLQPRPRTGGRNTTSGRTCTLVAAERADRLPGRPPEHAPNEVAITATSTARAAIRGIRLKFLRVRAQLIAGACLRRSPRPRRALAADRAAWNAA